MMPVNHSLQGLKWQQQKQPAKSSRDGDITYILSLNHKRCHRSAAAAADRARADDDSAGWYDNCNAASPPLSGGRNAVESRLFSLLTDSHSDLRRQTKSYSDEQAHSLIAYLIQQGSHSLAIHLSKIICYIAMNQSHCTK